MTSREFAFWKATVDMLAGKLDQIISLLEVRQNAEHGGDHRAQVDEDTPSEPDDRPDF